MTVADYCRAMQRNEITINKNYQRSDKVWPPAARSFLIETILQGYPIPKFFLHQRTDVKSKKTIKEIVDGQQRSKAIFDFYTNEFSLAKTCQIEGAAGKSYDDLHEDLQAAFLQYSISIDLFIGVTDEDIREAFRRLNSYTIPLNPEEMRNAEFQGPFKWFVYDLTRDYAQFFLDAGVFGTKQIVRMADAKLFTETIHALKKGITTTSKTDLRALYKDNDKDFPTRDEVERRIKESVDLIAQMPELFNSNLMRPHVFYSYLLAVTHMIRPCPALEDAVPSVQFAFDRDIALSNLSRLDEALEQGDVFGDFAEFVAASQTKTNVAKQRSERTKWIYLALQPQLL
jgi:hypothetical protein